MIIWLKKNCFDADEVELSPIEQKLRQMASNFVDTYAFKRITGNESHKTMRNVPIYTSSLRNGYAS